MGGLAATGIAATSSRDATAPNWSRTRPIPSFLLRHRPKPRLYRLDTLCRKAPKLRRFCRRKNVGKGESHGPRSVKPLPPCISLVWDNAGGGNCTHVPYSASYFAACHLRREWVLLAALWLHGRVAARARRGLAPAGTASPGVDPQPGGQRAEGGRSDDVTAFPESSCEIAEKSRRSISVDNRCCFGITCLRQLSRELQYTYCISRIARRVWR